MNCQIKCKQFAIKDEEDSSIPEIKIEPQDIRNEVKLEVEESQMLTECTEIESEIDVFHNFDVPVKTISETSVNHIKCDQFAINHEEDPLSIPEMKIEPQDIKNEVKLEVEESQMLTECTEIESEIDPIHNFDVTVKTISEEQDTEKGNPSDICGRMQNHSSSVVDHKELEHNERRFVCSECDKGFTSKVVLQRHLSAHSEDRPFVCQSCGASFKRKANLVLHQSVHTGEKKYICKLCGHQFAYKTSLTLHERWHAGVKPYQCHECNDKFSTKSNLQEHFRFHSGEKPFSCDHCGRKFTTKSQIKIHVMRHIGEKPWKCEFCSKSFLYKVSWVSHIMRHQEERRFQCTFVPVTLSNSGF